MIKSKLVESAGVIMVISRGSSLNADTIEITITKGDKQLFREKYFYGYNASYDRSWASKKAPYIGDIMQELKDKYKVTEVKEVKGRNVFRDDISD